MKLLLRTFSSHEEYNADCDMAVVEITPNDAKTILARRKALFALPGLVRASFYDNPVFLSASLAEKLFGDEAVEKAWEEQPVRVPDDTDMLAIEGERTECEMIWLHQENLTWTCYPKHADIRIETASVPYSVIEGAI